MPKSRNRKQHARKSGNFTKELLSKRTGARIRAEREYSAKMEKLRGDLIKRLEEQEAAEASKTVEEVSTDHIEAPVEPVNELVEA